MPRPLQASPSARPSCPRWPVISIFAVTQRMVPPSVHPPDPPQPDIESLALDIRFRSHRILRAVSRPFSRDGGDPTSSIRHLGGRVDRNTLGYVGIDLVADREENSCLISLRSIARRSRPTVTI
jgi:hypothetical protein